MLLRLIVALLLVGLVGLGTRWYRAWRRGVEAEQPPHPRVPAQLLDGAARTWVLFTTPYCASCGPAEQRLRATDPSARVIKVDATAQPDLAREFAIRAAPTALLADEAGEVQARLVGAAAVDRWARQQTDAADPVNAGEP